MFCFSIFLLVDHQTANYIWYLAPPQQLHPAHAKNESCWSGNDTYWYNRKTQYTVPGEMMVLNFSKSMLQCGRPKWARVFGSDSYSSLSLQSINWSCEMENDLRDPQDFFNCSNRVEEKPTKHRYHITVAWVYLHLLQFGQGVSLHWQ